MADSFYQSTAWFKVRAKALVRDKYLCVFCGTSVRGKAKARVDHIQPRKQYPLLALELSNLRTLCATCDNRRHASKLGRIDYEDRPMVGNDGFIIGSEWAK